MADSEHLKILKNGVDGWNAWRKANPHIKPDLAKADLFNKDLSLVDLTNSNLICASFSNATMIGADLSLSNIYEADFTYADFTNANLSGSSLSFADFNYTNLSGANLRVTDLRSAVIRNTTLTGADFSQAIMGWTQFSNLDLSDVRGLELMLHSGPSTIGVDTIYRSKGKISSEFLKRAGVPDDLLKYLESNIAVSAVGRYYRCMISFSAKDERFVGKLYSDLGEKVKVWRFVEDAKWGTSKWEEIRHRIYSYDKMLLVCSENSLASHPVVDEIEIVLEREDKEERQILFPIRLDDYVFNSWEYERKERITKPWIGDFSRWEDKSEYDKSFKKLLECLERGRTHVS